MGELGGFIERFSIRPDLRVARTKKHNLIDILFIGVCTVICGGEGFTDMEDFAAAKEGWLRKYLKGRPGIRRAMKRAACLNSCLEQILVS